MELQKIAVNKAIMPNDMRIINEIQNEWKNTLEEFYTKVFEMILDREFVEENDNKRFRLMIIRDTVNLLFDNVSVGEIKEDCTNFRIEFIPLNHG